MDRRVFAVVITILLGVGVTASAQWLNYPTQGIPRLPDGSPNLTAPAPRTADGKPDLSGVWHVLSESLEEKRRLFGPTVGVVTVPGMEPTTTSKYGNNILIDFKPGEIVMTPEADARYKRAQRGEIPSTTSLCLPAGIPRATLLSEVQKIVQTPRLILIMHELDSMTRQIYVDGRTLPDNATPSWLGYSVARWDGDTLVVDTIGFNDRAPLDSAGHPRSEAMHITERYHRRDVGHLDVAMTFDDPKSYTKPFTVNVTHLLQPDADILEYVCNENEKDRQHMPR
jgi:hypothetical protein